MPFNYKDCMERKLLRPVTPSPQQAERSRENAQSWLEEAEKTIRGKAWNATVIASYMAMFHAARAILYHDGLREKSHLCISRYLEEKYVKSGKLEPKWIQLLDYYRDLRHHDQYDVNFLVTETETRKCLQAAQEFTQRLGTLLNTLPD